jgi:condensin-2 complex subunit D3
LGFNLPCAAVAAHLAALHRLTQGAGGQGEVGAPARWCARVLEAAEEVLAQALEARGSMVGGRGRATSVHIKGVRAC